MKRTQGLLAAAVLASSLFSVTAAHADSSIGEEVKIDGTQTQPKASAGIDLNKDYAVWIDNNDTDQAITLFDRDTNKMTKIADNGKNKSFLKVEGNYVVWLEESNNQKYIILYDISSKKTTQVTTDVAVPTELDFDGKTIVWTDKRDSKSNIYAYQLANAEELQITTSNKASKPTVSKTLIAWQDDRKGNLDIYYYDLNNQQEKQATTNSKDQFNPSVNGGVIAFEDTRRGIHNIYYYDIADRDEVEVTDEDDDSTNPHIYGNYIVFEQDDELNFYNKKTEKSKSFSSDFYGNVLPAMYGDDVLYVTRPERNEYKLELYNLDEDEVSNFGSNIDTPSQPDASDKYVVFLNDGKENEIVLYDVNSKNLKAISDSDQDPVHPVVSNSYAAWYDKESEQLYSYNTKTEAVKAVTKSSDDPSDEVFDVDGANLAWVDDEDTLKLTNLATGKTSEIDSGDDILSVDICGDRVMWVVDKGNDKKIIYYYSIKEDEINSVSANSRVIGDAHLTDNYIVWSEKETNWDLKYYDFSRDRIYPVLRSTDGDQINPQVSRNFLVFEDNQYNRDHKYEFQLYDLDNIEYSDLYFSEDADPTQVRLGGNRMVWLDKRDEEPGLYMMTFAKAQVDDDDNGTDPGNGDDQRYTFKELVDTDKLADVLLNNDDKKVQFVFYEGTSKEIKYSFYDLTHGHTDEITELILENSFDKIIVQVLP